MTQLTITPLHEDFGAQVTGVQLSGDLPEDVIEEIREAFDTYSLLCFPDQDMNDEKHLGFTRLLGEPEAEHVRFGKTGEVSFFGTVGNVKEDGTKDGSAAANTHYQTGNQMWHADSSFRETPSRESILHAYEVPGERGNTDFVSMRAAYDRLPQDLKDEIEPLYVVHDYVFSRSKVAPVDPNHAASLPPVRHKLVKTNPRNGKKNFFIGSHARSIPGYSGIDSRRLLDDLLERTVRPEHVYSHKWLEGQTVIWDNRCTLHRGTGYDADRWRRNLRQTRVVGDEKGVIPQP